jgi:HSP20 family molecular chaperone IbpA
MWAEAVALLDEAEGRHRQFFALLTAPSAPPAWEPPVNIFKDGCELHVTVALPGAAADDIAVELTGGGLQVETRVSPPPASDRMELVRLEIPYGRMRRCIALPPGRYVLHESLLERGCLSIRLRSS